MTKKFTYINAAKIALSTVCFFTGLNLAAYKVAADVETNYLRAYQLVVPPEEGFTIGHSPYMTYDYTTKPDEQKPYIITYDDNGVGTYRDPDEFSPGLEKKIETTGREAYYSSCVWTSNVVIITQIPLPCLYQTDADGEVLGTWITMPDGTSTFYPFTEEYDYKKMSIISYVISVEGADGSLIDLTDVAEDKLKEAAADEGSRHHMTEQLVRVLNRTALDRPHNVIQTLEFEYDGVQYTHSESFEFMHTFPPVKLGDPSISINPENLSGSDYPIIGQFQGEYFATTHNRTLEHRMDIRIPIIGGNNIDPAILDDLEAIRNTKLTVHIEGQPDLSRKMYFNSYNVQENAIVLSRCNPNNWVDVDEDGNWTLKHNTFEVETSFDKNGTRVFGTSGSDGDRARFDEADISLKEAAPVAPQFQITPQQLYRVNAKIGENAYEQRLCLLNPGIDMETSGFTTVGNDALVHGNNAQGSHLAVKINREFIANENKVSLAPVTGIDSPAPAELDYPELLHHAADLEDRQKPLILARSNPFHWYAEMDSDPILESDDITQAELGLAYVYIFRTGRTMGSAVGAIRVTSPLDENGNPTPEPRALDDATTDGTGDAIDYHTLHTPYSYQVVNINSDIMTGLDSVSAEDEARPLTGEGWVQTPAGAEVYSVAGHLVAAGEGRHEVAPGVYLVRVSDRCHKVVVK